MALSKKYYHQLARILAKNRVNRNPTALEDELAAFLAHDNPAFRHSTFEDAIDQYEKEYSEGRGFTSGPLGGRRKPSPFLRQYYGLGEPEGE